MLTCVVCFEKQLSVWFRIATLDGRFHLLHEHEHLETLAHLVLLTRYKMQLWQLIFSKPTPAWRRGRARRRPRNERAGMRPEGALGRSGARRLGLISTRTSTTMGTFAGKQFFTGDPCGAVRTPIRTMPRCRRRRSRAPLKRSVARAAIGAPALPVEIIGPSVALLSHRLTSSMPLPGIVLDHIASLIKFLRFFEADWPFFAALDSFLWAAQRAA